MKNILPAALLVLALSACGTTVPSRPFTVKSDDGVSELTAWTPWASRPDLSNDATIRIADTSRENYLMVNSYHPGEIDRVSLEQLALSLSSNIKQNLENGRISMAKKFVVNGMPAVQYTVTGGSGELALAYLSTVIEGKKVKHHVIGWTLSDYYGKNRGVLEKITTSFRESAEKRRARKRVDLTFKWPKRLKTRITMTSKETKGKESTESVISGTSSVRSINKNELLITSHIRNKKFKSSRKIKGQDKFMQKVMKEAMTDIPDYVINREGEFVRVENLGRYAARVEKAIFDNLPGKNKESRQYVRQLLSASLSEQTLSLLMQDGWNTTVGNWIDSSYAKGVAYTEESTYSAPALGARTFPMTITRKLEGYAKCNRKQKRARCVRLVQTSRVDDPSFTRAMTRYIRKNLPGGNRVTFKNVVVLKKTVLITDPESLIPHSETTTETKSFVITADGNSSSTEEVRKNRTIYRY